MDHVRAQPPRTEHQPHHVKNPQNSCPSTRGLYFITVIQYRKTLGKKPSSKVVTLNHYSVLGMGMGEKRQRSDTATSQDSKEGRKERRGLASHKMMREEEEISIMKVDLVKAHPPKTECYPIIANDQSEHQPPAMYERDYPGPQRPPSVRIPTARGD